MTEFSFAPKSVAVVLGTRPEIIKLAGVIRLLGDAATIIHTGQHFDRQLSDSIWEEFRLPDPDVFLEVGGSPRGQQIGETVTRLDGVLSSIGPRALIVQGDTNSAAAGSVAANARGVFLCHIEAGLRSFDRRMPEEHNRVIADHLSDLCCAPTEVNVGNLEAEGIAPDRIVETGNTVVEAVEELSSNESKQEAVCARFGVEPRRFVLSTFHRPENVDDPDSFATIIEELSKLSLPVLYPIHPRSAKMAKGHHLVAPLGDLMLTEPVGYRDFLALMAASALVISDSGGVQEEVSVLKRPVVVVRRSTERPEVIGTFARLVEPGPGIGSAAQTILSDLEEVHRRLGEMPSPYGDGTASQRSLKALTEALG